MDCLAKSRDLQARLIELKSEMEDMRADTNLSDLDRLHEENQQRGDNKYSTLQKVNYSTLHTVDTKFRSTLQYRYSTLQKVYARLDQLYNTNILHYKRFTQSLDQLTVQNKYFTLQKVNAQFKSILEILFYIKR
jgi:hypothetical protein